MEKTRLIYLHQRFLDHSASREEIQEFRDALGDPDVEEIFKSQADQDWVLAEKENVAYSCNYERIYEQMINKPQESKRSRLWPRIVAAVAITIIVFGVSLFYFNKYTIQNPKQTANIAPGKMEATLTLGSGKKIKLSDAGNGKLAQEAGISIRKTADGQIIYEMKASSEDSGKINTLSTAKGGTYQLRLPDGSRVWLNAASSLTYTSTLYEHGTRRVKLNGEAYFEIKKDKTYPFIVESRGQQVEVLGTHFNISSYDNDESVKTTLLEGSVKVTWGNGGLKILKPNQQAVFQGKDIQVNAVDAEYAVAWKNGYFMFNNENLEAVMNKIARWYNVEIQYEYPSLKRETFFGTISKFEDISKVLKMIERTDVATFEIKGNVVKIAKRKKQE